MKKKPETAVNNELALYALRNHDGLWFRSKGYGGTGANWVEDFQKAKLYSKIGPARGQVSYYANHFKSPPPILVKLVIGNIVEIDESERVQKQKQKKLAEQARQIAYEKEWKLKSARERAIKALAEIKQLSGEDHEIRPPSPALLTERHRQ